MKSVVTGTHPYTFARVSAMKAGLIPKDDYARLIKMSFNELTSFIQEGTYKKEVDELAINYKGVELLELALNKNLKNTVEKIKRISKSGLLLVIEAYLMRNDVKNTKSIIRGIYTKSPEEELERFLLPSGIISDERLQKMIEADDIEIILNISQILGKKEISEVIKSYKESGTLIEIETALDKNYYSKLVAFSEQIPKQGKLIREFLEKEIVILNIITSLRLKRAGVPGNEIEKYIIPSKSSGKIAKAAGEPDTLITLLASLRLEEESRQGIDDLKQNNSLVRLETDLYKHLLKDAIALLRRHPLTVDVILGYLFAKEIEVRNLKMILKSKQLGMDEAFMEEHLVV